METVNPKTPEEAARLAEQRAVQAQGQYKQGGVPAGFTSAEVFAALRDNEIGDSRLLIKVMKDRFTFDVKRQLFFRFAGGYWQKDLEEESLAFAARTLREAYGNEAQQQLAVALDLKEDEKARNAAQVKHDRLKRRLDQVNTLRRQKNVLKLAATGLQGIVTTGNQWNIDPWTLQAGELLIDLKTGEARPGRPGDYINKAAPTKWKGLDEPAVAWTMFLHQIFNQDSELVAYIQRVLGSALVGKQNSQEFYILWGATGRNGKSTALETLKEVLGADLASSVRSEMVMESKQGGGGNADPELLDLQGKRIVWTSETGDGKRLNTERMKLFTGGDTLAGRLNYSNEMIRFKPTHSLFMLTNHRPRIGGGDAAVWSRLRLIPFLLSFVDDPIANHERKKDPDLQEKLLREASGILAWLVRGCLDWQKNGLNPPQTVMEAGREYKMDEDPLQQFVNERCHLGTGYKAQAKPLYDDFAAWFTETYGARASVPSLKRFSEQLQKLTGITREVGSRYTYFHGLTLTARDDAPEWVKNNDF